MTPNPIYSFDMGFVTGGSAGGSSFLNPHADKNTKQNARVN
jgi:hypothetical protein